MEKLNEGYCAELFAVHEHKILKLYKPGWSKNDVLQEYENTKAANELGIPSPRMYDFTEHEGRYGFVMEKLVDFTMLHRIQKNPFQAIKLAKQMAKLHFEMHSIPLTDPKLPSQKDAYTQKIQNCLSLSNDHKENLICLLEQFSHTGACSVCHGDFHPMNILFQGKDPVIIDWAFSTSGDPCGDVAGTYMITKLLATASAARNGVERFLYNVFTPLFAEIYLKEYLKRSGRSREEILQWIPIRAATYLDLGLPQQTNEHLRNIAQGITDPK